MNTNTTTGQILPDASTPRQKPVPKSAPAQPEFIIRRPTSPEQFYVSSGHWTLDPLKALQFKSAQLAMNVARKINVSGLRVKLAMSQADADAALQTQTEARAAIQAGKERRRDAKIARKEKRIARHGKGPKGLTSAAGIPTPM